MARWRATGNPPDALLNCANLDGIVVIVGVLNTRANGLSGLVDDNGDGGEDGLDGLT